MPALSFLLSCILSTAAASGGPADIMPERVSIDFGFTSAISKQPVIQTAGDITRSSYRPLVTHGMNFGAGYGPWTFELGTTSSILEIREQTTSGSSTETIAYDGIRLNVLLRIAEYNGFKFSGMAGTRLWYGGGNIAFELLPHWLVSLLGFSPDLNFIQSVTAGFEVDFRLWKVLHAYIRPGLDFYLWKSDPDAWCIYSMVPVLPSVDFGLRLNFDIR